MRNQQKHIQSTSLSKLIRPVCTTTCCADTPRHKTEDETERTGHSLQHICSLSQASPSFASVSDWFLTQINRKWPTPDMKKICKNYCYRRYPRCPSCPASCPQEETPRRSLITCLYPVSPFFLLFPL